MSYKLINENRIYPGNWEVYTWDSDSIENLTLEQCSWWWNFLVNENGIDPKTLKIVSNDFDLSPLNPPSKVEYGIEEGV
tara:strand:+ start:2096 stop:2332 length:237 start_codon:yes stop_codon:yes gene_type:complete